MELVLRDGYIYLVKNKVSADNNIEADVVVKYIDNHQNRTYHYSINGGAFKPIRNLKLKIEREDLKGPYLDLRIKAGDEIFKSDKLPLTYSLIVGAPIEDVYEQTINALFNRITNVNQRLMKKEAELLKKIEELNKRIIDIEERGELL